MEYDELLDIIGELGPYQFLVFILSSTLAFQTVWNNMGIVFLAAVPDHFCKVPELESLNLTLDILRNITIPHNGGSFSKCQMYQRNYTGWTMQDVDKILLGDNETLQVVPCSQGWNFDDSVYKSTIVTQFNLVCDKEPLVALSQSIYMAGLMVGTLLLGNLADRLGRRVALIISLVIGVTFSLATAFSNSYWTFTILRFFVGFGVIGCFIGPFVLVIEMVGSKWRAITGISIQYFWAIGYMIFGVLAYFVRDWTTLQLAHSVPPVLFFLFFLIIPESPRWLYVMGKHEKADKIVRKMAKWNKKSTPEPLKISVKEIKQTYLWDLFKYPTLRIRTVVIFSIWFFNSIVYYGIALNTSSLGGNDFVNFIVSGAVEIPAYLICNFILNNIGRRWPQCLTMLFAGAALLLTMAVPKGNEVWIVVLAMFGKAFISMSFGIIYVFSAELFPTVCRNSAVGAGSFWARLGGVIAPQIARLAKFSKFVPLVAFAVMSLVAGLLALILPETNNRKLPETLEDGENFPNCSPSDTMLQEVNGKEKPKAVPI